MANNSNSSRRSFLKGGALLAAPLAAASVSVASLAQAGANQRLGHLEDEAAIRALQQSWLRRVNAGEERFLLEDPVRRITSHHAGTPDRIEIAGDGRSAVGYYDSAVELEAALDRDSTLGKMAHAQGNGGVLRTERRLLTVGYTRQSGGVWVLGRITSKAP